MKQLIFVGLLMLVGTLGPFVYSPFCGVAIYYTFATLRPQFIWQWSLPQDIQWSRFVALATTVAMVASKLGLVKPVGDPSRRSKGLSRTDSIMLVFFCWITITYAMAHDREVAFPYYQEYLKILVMYAVSTVILGTIRQLWILLILTAVSLGYISYEVNFLYIEQGYGGIARNGYGGLDNNGAGLMLAMGVPLCLVIWDGMAGRLRWAFLALIPIIIHAVLLTYSRGAMLSLVVMTPLLVFRCRRKGQIAPYLILLVIMVHIMAGPEIQARFLTITKSEADESANSRRASWAAAWAMAKDNPIFGVGVRNSNLFSFQYGADMEGRTIHSQYLQIAADCGFIGLALYVGVIASVCMDAGRVRRAIRGRTDQEASRARSVVDGVETSMLTFCFGGIFLSLETFELPYLLILMGSRALALAGPPGGPHGQSLADSPASH
jgi:probable O-glycosylation ligase (exosortase A-associated)